MEHQTILEKKIIKISYKKLYRKENKKRENVETHLEEKNKEIDKLKLLLRLKEIELGEAKVKLLSYNNSQTAKNGYKEEELVCKDLNNKTIIKETFSSILGNNFDECERITGNHKCDIQSKNKILKGQVKKYKNGQFQQLDRHWITNLIENIPELNDVLQIFKNLLEYPLLSNNTHVDKTKSIKKLCTSNYSQETLDNFLSILNKYKIRILKYAFLGTNLEIQPDYLFGVEYNDDKRIKIVVFKIKEIIDYLKKLEFKISPKKTVILLGNESIISLQRKGGDCGKKSSNHLQIKIILNKLINKVPNLQYKL